MILSKILIILCFIAIAGIIIFVVWIYESNKKRVNFPDRKFRHNSNSNSADKIIEYIAAYDREEEEIKELDQNCIDAIKNADELVAFYADDERLLKARDAVNSGTIPQAIKLLEQIALESESVQISGIDFIRLSRASREKISKRRKQYALAYLYLGALQWGSDKIREAVNSYNCVVRLDGSNPEVWMRLSQLYERIGNLHKAIMCNKKAAAAGERKRRQKIEAISEGNLNYLYDQRSEIKKRIKENKKGGF